MIKRLVFDVDGTLISQCDYVSVVTRVLTKIGKYSDEHAEKLLFGVMTYENHFNFYDKNLFIKYLSVVMGIKLNKLDIEILKEEFEKCIPPQNEHLKNTIEKLSEKYELVVLTNFFTKLQKNRLDNMGIGEYFKHFYGEDIIKPNPLAYIKACGENKPSECVMIGDNIETDIKGAKKAGLKTILVNTKKKDADKIDTLYVRRIEDLNEIIIDRLDKNCNDLER